MKIAPLYRQLRADSTFDVIIVHTGQHYDRGMSDVFFEQLGLPAPDVSLDVGSAPHGAQTGRVLERFESVLVAREPAAVVVVGDVNSTLACRSSRRSAGSRSACRSSFPFIRGPARASRRLA